MRKHTSGPWPIKREGLIIKSIGPCIPDEYAGSAWLEVSEADAGLIAAAPDLLEALHKIVNNWSDLHPKDRAQARAAIARAEGRSTPSHSEGV